MLEKLKTTRDNARTVGMLIATFGIPFVLIYPAWPTIRDIAGVEGAAGIAIIVQISSAYFLGWPMSEFLVRHFGLELGDKLFSCDQFSIFALADGNWIVQRPWNGPQKLPGTRLREHVKETVKEIARISFTQDEFLDATDVLYYRAGRACLWPDSKDDIDFLRKRPTELAAVCWKQGNKSFNV